MAIKNWETTALGLATIVMALASFAVYSLDGDAETVASVPATLAGITAGIGLIRARDGKGSDN